MDRLPARSASRVGIRPATAADVPAVASLIEASVRGLGPPHYDAQQINSSLVHLFGVDTAMIEDGTYLVAEDQGDVVGAGGWSRRRTPFGGDQAGAVRDAGLRDPAVDPAILRAFYVHPDAARRGLGRMLMDAAEAGARADGFTRFELVSTLPGLEFYRNCGYRDVEPVEIPLPDGVSIGAVRMVKP
jgi:GNAT superfamily N-acetyltransferase